MGERLEAVAVRADKAERTNEKFAIDIHRLIESVREDLRVMAERMATAEQLRRVEERLGDVDKRVTEQQPVVAAVPKLMDRMDKVEERLAEQAASVKSVPKLQERMTASEHRASHMKGALWVVGTLVALLGLAGLRELGRWFVQAQAPAVPVEEPAFRPRRRQ